MRTPPDGSAPCPGCDDNMGGAYSLMFNAMNRWPGSEMVGKLWDLKCSYPVALDPEMDHPALHAMAKAYRRLLEGTNGMVQDGLKIRWLPGTLEHLRRVMDEEVRPALVAYEPLKEAHFADKRHYMVGGFNTIRESRGSHHTLWGARSDTSYHHFVAVMGEGEHHNLVHRTCGTRLGLDECFLENLRRDPTFYGAVHCPSTRCRIGDIAFAEFDVVSLDRIETDMASAA